LNKVQVRFGLDLHFCVGHTEFNFKIGCIGENIIPKNQQWMFNCICNEDSRVYGILRLK